MRPVSPSDDHGGRLGDLGAGLGSRGGRLVDDSSEAPLRRASPAAGRELDVGNLFEIPNHALRRHRRSEHRDLTSGARHHPNAQRRSGRGMCPSSGRGWLRRRVGGCARSVRGLCWRRSPNGGGGRALIRPVCVEFDGRMGTGRRADRGRLGLIGSTSCWRKVPMN